MSTNTFKAVGKLIVSNNEAEFFNTYDTSNGRSYSLRFRMKDEVHNSSIRVGLFGSEQPVLNLMAQGGVKGEKITIQWKDRKDPSKIKSVAQFLRYRITWMQDGVKTYKEFITSYDMLMCAKEMLPKYNGKRIAIDGIYKRTLGSNDTSVFDNFDVRNIIIIDDSEDDKFEDTILVNTELFYNKASLMPTDEKNIYKLMGYTSEWIKSERTEKWLPVCAYLDLSGLYNGLEHANEEDVRKRIKAAIDMRLNFTQSKLPDDGTYVKLRWECYKKLGADVETVKYEDLTPAQQMMVDSGDAELEDFRGVGGLVDELRMIKPVFKGEFQQGFVETTVNEENLTNFVYQGHEKTELEEQNDITTEAMSDVDALLYGKH